MALLTAQFHDPLAINLRKQVRALISVIPSDSPVSATLLNAPTNEALLEALSNTLTIPALTLLVATTFRPILMDLCARWLQSDGGTEEKLVALCLLIEVHQELFPILSYFLRKPCFAEGPLAFLLSVEQLDSIDTPRLHRLLLAYYRILQANREFPEFLLWPVTPLSKLFWTPHPDPGVRLLSIRCYALQSGMCEAEKEKLESEILGERCQLDCDIEFSHETNGTVKYADGWTLPLLETKRVTDTRNAIVQFPRDYYTLEEGDVSRPIHQSELCPLLANVHGIFLLRAHYIPNSEASPLIHTPTTTQALRAMAINHSLRVPTLLTSAPSSGKSLLVMHLASLLFPGVKNQIVVIHLADTSLDPRSLLGSYVSSAGQPGVFEWKEGVLVRAMREGKWVVFEDIHRGSSEVLALIKPLVESLGLGKWIGGQAALQVPGRGLVRAHEHFAVFSTRSLLPAKEGTFPKPTFFGAQKWFEVVVPSPTLDELGTILDSQFPRLAGAPARALIAAWESVKELGSSASIRAVGLRDLNKFAARIDNILPITFHSRAINGDAAEDSNFVTIFPNTALREEIYLEARDVFFGGDVLTSSGRSQIDAISALMAGRLGLESDRSNWVLHGRAPEIDIERDADNRAVALRVGRRYLPAKATKREIATAPQRPFVLHKPAAQLLSRIVTAVSLGEAVLLTGETGTGKTSIITYLASTLRRTLVSLNLSHQTESSDLIGGFKPVDAKVPGSLLQEHFLDLFGQTFSRKKNVKFEESVRKAVIESKWKRTVALWKEAVRLAKERIQGWHDTKSDGDVETLSARKRRKVDSSALKSMWSEFERDVTRFEAQYVQAQGKFAFAFVEGPLVKALRSGDWVLLDEINLASPDTLEHVSSLLHNPTASITLTEQGSLEPVPRHPEFRLFACMNPANDVGKKNLPQNIRSRFTEIDVPPPESDKDTLLGIITQYIGSSAVGDKAAIMDVAEFFSSVKELAERHQIVDGSNRRPHFSMRTLVRVLTFAAEIAPVYGLRRALWEACLMGFTMVLNSSSARQVIALAQKHILAGVRNVRSVLLKEPAIPRNRRPEDFVKFGPFHVERGPLPEDSAPDYIITPSVETKLIDLARIIMARRFPVLIEGPTSSGKTSSIEYLARRTGHRFIRINNHEHTDIQEYLGSYVSDSSTGKLVFREGLLVRALRNGDWVVLDELNLAPTDVLEALNRLLDDNRELFIPETHEIVRPHPHFMLFATQNPPGLYAGRKLLSRAFRNRFLEVHFDDVPQDELETILCQRSRIAPSYAHRIVSVFRELQKRRQLGRVFESKYGFATLRDLFRWAGRDALGYQELAENGYMLLAERTRRDDDKLVVKDVIESIMKVRIDEKALYTIPSSSDDFLSLLGCPLPSSAELVWTPAMQRLFILLARALRFNEPVLLVGETGSGKTSVCQVYAQALSKQLHEVNCHQNTETADLIGGLRPVRNRATIRSEAMREAVTLLEDLGVARPILQPDSLLVAINRAQEIVSVSGDLQNRLDGVRRKLLSCKVMFEWHDGPLVTAMRKGDVFLLDEISLADDSVLERLNSVLEPSRTIVLAERGGDDTENQTIGAFEGFKLVATMNPGGDYGKKELSPALRNRFTEIWVPPVNDRVDRELIIDRLWKYPNLKPYTKHLLDFVEWLCNRCGESALSSLRDILAWVMFSNSAYHTNEGSMPLNEIFHHAAHMTFLDGLRALPQLSTFSPEALQHLKLEAMAKLQEIAPIPSDGLSYVPSCDPSTHVQLGSFAIPRGQVEPVAQSFSWHAPTTQNNAMRIVRASQVHKPILLEGSPGVGKTSLVSALANLCGYPLSRINLSDQTDLMDLFGSDLPVDGGAPGEFAWRDAAFLRAMQDGHWVLLDEMNLAPQAVLEGLNAVLDHRGTVYIPELDRSFSRHPAFRIFAAQNPLHQGCGRKGLPKSFVNRFTSVYVDEFSPQDLLLVCQRLFPSYDPDLLRAMIAYNVTLSEKILEKRAFGRQGGPWEFNLRDVLRWGTLLAKTGKSLHPSELVDSVYIRRFRNNSDRLRARSLFHEIFATSEHSNHTPRLTVSPSHLQLGHFQAERGNSFPSMRTPRILQCQLDALEAVGSCVSQSWLVIITGGPGSGKSSLIRALAAYTGNFLQEISVSNATDTMDILGGFEQVDFVSRSLAAVNDLLALANGDLGTAHGSRPLQLNMWQNLRAMHAASVSPLKLLECASDFLDHWIDADNDQVQDIRTRIQDLLKQPISTGHFEWIDGPLVAALKRGSWLVLDDANLCNPSVLDRLNPLCEADGTLTLNERGYIGGRLQIIKPHPNFRLFMTLDPQYGELSRAMRNRGMEFSLIHDFTPNDRSRLQDYLRLPTLTKEESLSDFLSPIFEARRRGLLSSGPESVEPWPSAVSFLQDSPLATVLRCAPLLSTMCEENLGVGCDVLHVLSRIMSPASVPLLSRWISKACGAREVVCQVTAGLLHHLGNQHPFRSLCRAHTESRDYPSGLILAQPIDFYLTCPSCHDCQICRTPPSAHFTLLHALRLVVAVFIELEGTPACTGAGASKSSALRSMPHDQRARMEAEQFLHALGFEARALRERVNTGDPLMDCVDIESMLDVLPYSSGLREALGAESLDYSAIQVLSARISDALKNSSPQFNNLKRSAESLEKATSLISGLGLSEIWTSFFMNAPLRMSSSELLTVERMACSMPKFDDRTKIRRHTFHVMALSTLPLAGEQDERSLIDPVFEVKELLSKHSRIYPEETSFNDEETHLLLAELAILSNIFQEHRQPQLLEKIIQLTCQNPSGSLVRLLPYQHVAWSGQSADVSCLVWCQFQWLRALWTSRLSHDILSGPSILFRPTQLWLTVNINDWRRRPLHQLADYEESLNRNIQLVSLRRGDPTTRVNQLTELLLQLILTISSCFLFSFETVAKHSFMSILSTSESGLPPSFDQIVRLLDGLGDNYFARSIQTNLLPALKGLHSRHPSGLDIESTLGRCYIAFGRLVLDLCVPDIPVDPAALKIVGSELSRLRHASVLSQEGFHSTLERNETGREINSILDYLAIGRQDTEANAPRIFESAVFRRNDISGLQIYWSDISRFVSQVLNSPKFGNLLLGLEHRDQSANMQEQVLQQSISGFCQRLDSIYPKYEDISAILQYALYSMKLGLRLITTTTSSKGDNNARELCAALVISPSARCAQKLLSKLQSGINGIPAIKQLLLWLASINFEVSMGINIETHAGNLATLCDQALRLWLIDRTKAAESLEESLSLYRRRSADDGLIGDAELEKEEFLALFPNFEDAIEPTRSQQDDNLPSRLFNIDQFAQVVNLFALVQERKDSVLHSGSDPADVFMDYRLNVLEGLLPSQINLLSDVLDVDSYLMQLSLLHRRLTHLDGTRAPGSYNFYTDPDVSQMKKAISVVYELRERLESLVHDWPDQMVLQQLLGRCDWFLKLNLSSSVAKALTALEQLLVHTEDWEVYANRENTLKPHQQSLISLIVEWRRLELSCWRGLLQSQTQAFSARALDLWFPLYNALVRGVLDASTRDQMEEPGVLTSYLSTLVTLLDNFIRTSPLGEFHARMNLLREFCLHVRHRNLLCSSTARAALERVLRILRSTIAFYEMFSALLLKTLSEQKVTLEQEIQAYIKLASWKDINVQALKQSAQRTHHHLYKIIRKFRTVLRQPIEDRLQAELAGESECVPSSLDANSPSPFAEIDATSFPATSTQIHWGHLTNLKRTYNKFVSLTADAKGTEPNFELAHAVDSLAVNIIIMARALSQESVSSGPTAQRQKQAKALLVRKRKAWSDLLKELKRGGLASNIKPAILNLQSNALWIREQSTIVSDTRLSKLIQSSENYFHRLNGRIPELRKLLSSHHADLTTRELQRGVMYVESAFAIALVARTSLADHLGVYEDLLRHTQRLKSLSCSTGLAVFDNNLLSGIVAIHGILSRLCNALMEAEAAVQTAQNLSIPSEAQEVTESLRSMASHTTTYRDSLAVLDSNVKLASTFIVLSDDEYDLIRRAFAHVESSLLLLQKTAQSHARFDPMLFPIKHWLATELARLALPIPLPTTASSDEGFSVVNALLLTVQAIYARHSNEPDEICEDSDLYIRDGAKAVSESTHLLNLPMILGQMHDCLAGLATCSGPIIQINLRRFVPFLTRYLYFAEAQLLTQSHWVKTLFKLDLVLCTIMQTLAKQGFCKPIDVEEGEAGGDTVGAMDGLGIGEGEGQQNVSKDIEDEYQVEGLQGQEEGGKNSTGQDEGHDDAIEMEEDFGGDLEDISESNEGSSVEGETDEQFGHLDPSDPSAIDEKLWGGEEAPNDPKDADKKTDKPSKSQDEQSEMVAKEGSRSRKDSDCQIDSRDNDRDASGPEDNTDEIDEGQIGDGAPLDDHIQEANMLDLPDDLDFNSEDPKDLTPDEDEEMADGEGEGMGDVASPDEEPKTGTNDVQENAEELAEDAHGQPEAQAEDHLLSTNDQAENSENATARPDISSGDGSTTAVSSRNLPEEADSSAPVETGGRGEVSSQEIRENESVQAEEHHATETLRPQTDPDMNATQGAGEGRKGQEEGFHSSEIDQQFRSNPLRNLGDALQEVRQQFNEILDALSERTKRERSIDNADAPQLEYLRPNDDDHEMQALGGAGEEQAAKLHELKLVDDAAQEPDLPAPMDVDSISRPELIEQPSRLPPHFNDPSAHAMDVDVEGAILDIDIRGRDPSARTHLPPDPLHRIVNEDRDVQAGSVEVELKTWQVEGYPGEGAERIWRLYESLTHDLAYALCEQLRLILAPTRATRLKGDYRTGKRLNMKKIIPYIASDYRKDKIWLRRTKPSSREYQVLIALDDSRSMAESHSVHLAFETLALVSTALNRLEVGDIAIARFGETVDILHGFDEGSFTAQAGIKVINAFRFDQKATDVYSLVDVTLKLLESGRDHRTMSSSTAADLWQLEIIISDGMCQNHDQLRPLLRKAWEQRVMIVFIIIDSLHVDPKAGANLSSMTPQQNSILSMNQVSYKDVEGRMEMQVERYLDSFPFEYFVVLRTVEALPEVLSNTLKQFFERISEE